MESNGFVDGVITKAGEAHDDCRSPPRESSAFSKILDTEMRASVMMELIVDKLKLLNYEHQFCNSRSPPWPRLHKFYFALPSANRNEQFLYFSSMVAWLFEMLGCQFAPPSEVDDPNVTCTKIMMELMSMGFAAPSWPPARLKQGYGDPICSVLDALCSLVLDAIKFKFLPVSHLHHKEFLEEDSAYNDTTSELYVVDEQNAELESYSDENTPRIVDPQMPNDFNTMLLLEPNYNTNKWKLDLERIAPQLRVVVVADGNDWRTHLDRAKKLFEETFASFAYGKTHLNRFEENITLNLEKLESHENFINHQCETLILEYMAVKRRLSGVQSKYDENGEIISKLTCEHAKLLESLDQIKQKMVNKGNEIADLSPLLQMKAAMQRLKVELKEMEVHIGLLEHTLVQVSLKQAKRNIDEGS